MLIWHSAIKNNKNVDFFASSKDKSKQQNKENIYVKSKIQTKLVRSTTSKFVLGVIARFYFFVFCYKIVGQSPIQTISWINFFKYFYSQKTIPVLFLNFIIKSIKLHNHYRCEYFFLKSVPGNTDTSIRKLICLNLATVIV